jgi:hypothetical protein
MVNPYGRGAGKFQFRVSSRQYRRLLLSSSSGGREGGKEEGREGGRITLYGCYLTSLVSSIREISALLNVGKMPLLPRLLNGDRDPSLPRSLAPSLPPSEAVDAAFAELGEGFGKAVLGKFNPSQVGAIKAAATNKGFTLIKGPPGTGTSPPSLPPSLAPSLPLD